MQCGQGKPFTVTSTNSKMGSVAVRSYEKGGVVTKPMESKPMVDPKDRRIYTAEMGDPPQDMDMMTSLTPAQRKAAEARMKAAQSKKK